MALRVADRRAAKAARRRQHLREQRAAVPVSLADRVRSLAGGSIVRCLLQPEMFETGIGTVLLAREMATGANAVALFLVDVFSIGIKDAIFEVMEPSELDFYVSTMALAAPWHAVEPSYARKLLGDAATYATTLGVRPHRGFVAIERLFGNVRAADCAEAFVFGRDGRPFYAVGPTESTEQIARRLGRMAERLGPDGFDFVIPISDGELAVSGAPLPLADNLSHRPRR